MVSLDLIVALFTDRPLLFFGIASGVLSTFAYIPYIIDTARRRTRPQRAAWLIWSVLGSIAFVSQVYEGATSSLWFAGVQIAGTIIVFSLSIWVGRGNYLAKTDYLILLAALAGLILWYFTETAAYALAITISISLRGGLATAIKAYKDPKSETLITWVVSLIASACALLSVGKMDFIILAYPLYLFTLYFAFVVAILAGHAREKRTRFVNSPIKPFFTVNLFTSGLRVAADTVIVFAGLLFALNWLDSIEDDQIYVDRNVTALSTARLLLDNQEALAETPIMSVASTPVNYKSSFPKQATAVQSDTQFRPASHKVTKFPNVLELSDYLEYNGLVQQKPYFLTSTSNSEQRNTSETLSKENSALPDSLAQTNNQLVENDWREFTQQSEWFQMLDEGDPFTHLTVTSNNARIIPPATNTSSKPVNLPPGSNLQAIATNGKWFIVQSPLIGQGYVHHTHVAIEVLSELSVNLAPGTR